MSFSYQKATRDDLEHIWAKNIAESMGDGRWVAWKDEAIENNRSGKALTFIVACEGDPVGEGTLLFSPECSAINGRTQLCDNLSCANVNALRIEERFEGQGHISRLMREIERYAADSGYSYLSIGVEAREARNLAIYLHWGYTEFLLSETEDGALVLYYRKKIK